MATRITRTMITTIAGMGWVQGLNLAPLAFIMTAAVFRSMDPTLEEAANMQGAGLITVLRRITLRLAWPGILAAAIYIFMTAFAAFDVPAIIGWGNRIFTFSTYLYLLLNPQDVLPSYGPGAAFSTVAMGLAGVMSAAYAAMPGSSRPATGPAASIRRLYSSAGTTNCGSPAWSLAASFGPRGRSTAFGRNFRNANACCTAMFCGQVTSSP